MPTARARKLCPKLIVLPGDYERYEQIFPIGCSVYAYDFTPNVEQTSIDEGYFDITANRSKPSIEIAQTISKAIRQSFEDHRQRRHRLEQAGQSDCLQAQQARCLPYSPWWSREAVPSSLA